MSESNEPERPGPVSISMEPGSTGTMKITISMLNGDYVWMPVTADDWEQIKQRGDTAMADTIRISGGE